MEWIAKYYDNVYLLTDEIIGDGNKIVYVSPEDITEVIDHRSLNYTDISKPCKVIWCYEPGEKMVERTRLVRNMVRSWVEVTQ